jgi:hypothetical protein
MATQVDYSDKAVLDSMSGEGRDLFRRHGASEAGRKLSEAIDFAGGADGNEAREAVLLMEADLVAVLIFQGCHQEALDLADHVEQATVKLFGKDHPKSVQAQQNTFRTVSRFFQSRGSLP